jgi:hypothetical protein
VGRAISDLGVLRDQPELFGAVASTATAWRRQQRIQPEPALEVRGGQLGLIVAGVALMFWQQVREQPAFFRGETFAKTPLLWFWTSHSLSDLPE